jgi:hypothetical protein
MTEIVYGYEREDAIHRATADGWDEIREEKVLRWIIWVEADSHVDWGVLHIIDHVNVSFKGTYSVNDLIELGWRHYQPHTVDRVSLYWPADYPFTTFEDEVQ